MPDIRENMLGVASEPTPSSPEELNKCYADWIAIFTKVAKEAGRAPK